MQLFIDYKDGLLALPTSNRCYLMEFHGTGKQQQQQYLVPPPGAHECLTPCTFAHVQSVILTCEFVL